MPILPRGSSIFGGGNDQCGLVSLVLCGLFLLSGCGTTVKSSKVTGLPPQSLNRLLVLYSNAAMSASQRNSAAEAFKQDFAKCGVAVLAITNAIGTQEKSDLDLFDPNYVLDVVWKKMTTIRTNMSVGKEATLAARLYNYKTKSTLWDAELEYHEPAGNIALNMGNDFSSSVVSQLRKDGILKDCS